MDELSRMYYKDIVEIIKEENNMSDSIKKYEEMQEPKVKYITEELIEERLTMKGYSEEDSHDPEHVMDAVCKHFDIELTDTWKPRLDYYIYEESTADGYTVYVATPEPESVSVSEHIFYYDNDLSEILQEAITDADYGGAEIYVSMLYDCDCWLEDAMQSLYIELIKKYTEDVTEELLDEGYTEPFDAKGHAMDILMMIANNE